jgi:hypothetical protein
MCDAYPETEPRCLETMWFRHTFWNSPVGFRINESGVVCCPDFRHRPCVHDEADRRKCPSLHGAMGRASLTGVEAAEDARRRSYGEEGCDDARSTAYCLSEIHSISTY